MSDRIAVYAGTRNLYHDMTTAAKSLLYHGGADHVYFLTEDDVFPETLPDCITCMNVSNQTFFDPSGPNFRTMWTYMVLMRVAVSKLFPQYDRILTLDVDTIVRKPIDFLWDINLGDNYYAAVRERYPGHRRPQPYFNFGVVMHNLQKLRADGMDDVIIRTLNTTYQQYPEQDAANSACFAHILELPQPYNAVKFNVPPVPEDDIIIKHYADTRGIPLNSHEDYQFYDAMTWDNVLRHE